MIEQYENPILPTPPEAAMLFSFPEDARWNDDRKAVEFGIGLGEYEGVVRVGRSVFQHLLSDSPTPERCLEGYHLHRTRFERIAEQKLRHRQLADDANVEITGRDMSERGTAAAPKTERDRRRAAG
jgi:hypothetical protein